MHHQGVRTQRSWSEAQVYLVNGNTGSEEPGLPFQIFTAASLVEKKNGHHREAQAAPHALSSSWLGMTPSLWCY